MAQAGSRPARPGIRADCDRRPIFVAVSAALLIPERRRAQCVVEQQRGGRRSDEPSIFRVEAGAQGEHKLARGYMPVTTYSAHYIADPALRRAIADYLKRERAYVAAAGNELAAMGPFRKDLVIEQT